MEMTAHVSNAETITNRMKSFLRAASISVPRRWKTSQICAEFVGRNVLRPATLPDANRFETDHAADQTGVVRAIEAVMTNNVSVVNVGTVVTVVDSGCHEIRSFEHDPHRQLPRLGSMLTHTAVEICQVERLSECALALRQRTRQSHHAH
jgi:hypothetical protein